MLKLFQGVYREHMLILYQRASSVWIGDYVLAGYGTGAVMAVPCGDRDMLLLTSLKDKAECREKKYFF
jgi:leucyl-tRNA synthetase